MPQLGQRRAAEMMRGDAVGIDAVRLAGALQRVLVAALLEVATGLLEQIGQGRIGSAFVEAGSRRRQRLRQSVDPPSRLQGRPAQAS